MAINDNRYAQAGAGQVATETVDQGLRAYMSRVYSYMSGGVLLSGLTAYGTYAMAVSQTKAGGGLVLTDFGKLMYQSPLKWVIMLLPLAFVLFLSFRAYKMSVAATHAAYWLFAAAMGDRKSVV